MVKIKWLILPLLIGFVILPRLSIDLYLPSLPHIGLDLHTNEKMLQMTLTAYIFGYALSMWLTGHLSNYMGKKKVMLSGLTIYLISTIVCMFAHSILLLIVARFFQALGGCCGTVVARVMVKEGYSKDEQIGMLAHLSTAMALSPLVTPVLGGILQTYFGWRSIFFVLAIISFILFITSKDQLLDNEKNINSSSPSKIYAQYKDLLTNKQFIGYSLAISFAWCDYFAFTLESPFLIQKTLGFSSIGFGFIFSLIVLGYVVGTQMTRILANKLGWDKFILIACGFCFVGAMILSILITVLPLNWEIMAFPMMIVMVGVGIIFPCIQGAVMQPFPHIAGLASGLFFFIQMCFGGLAGLILQAIGQPSIKLMSYFILISSVLLYVSFYKLIWINRVTETQLIKV